MTSTFPDRIRQAISDPGSITPRQTDLDSWGHVENFVYWQTRAVLQVVVEHHHDRTDDSGDAASPGFITAAIAVVGLLVFGVGVWLGSVWL